MSLALFGCQPAGSVDYPGGTPRAARARFTTPRCEVRSPVADSAAETQYYLIDGRKSYALLVLDQGAQGIEIENYWQDAAGHHFAIRQRSRVWIASLPDRRGAPGELAYFPNAPLSSYVEVGEAWKVTGTPGATCVMEPAELLLADGTHPIATPAPTQNCVPGSTQECTGAAACKGGQSCTSDGSGWNACDCGTASAPVSTSEAPPVSPWEESQ